MNASRREATQEGRQDVDGAVRVPQEGRFRAVFDAAREQGFQFRVALGGRKLMFGDHDATVKCHKWLYERGIRESLKVEHRLVTSNVIKLTVDGELWL